MKMRFSTFIALVVMTALPVHADALQVVFKAKKGAFPVVTSGHRTPIIIYTDTAEVVRTAVDCFRDDIHRVTGASASVASSVEGGACPILVGTLGQSAYIDELANTGKIDATRVRRQWETFGISVVKNPFAGVNQALVVFGSDARGTAYGLMELSRMMGVSPWYWWADVPAEQHDAVYVTAGSSVYGPPSVKYRGLFINDEDWGLQPWAARHLDADIRDLGPKTYEKVFELMLRMKCNLCWPAMHPCTKAFWYYKESPKVAHKYGIVLGSSHCEQMLRNNVDEWVKNFQGEYGMPSGEYSWKINAETICRYWEDRVKESKDNEVVYTLGMRGIHDSGLPGYASDEERRGVLKGIIDRQRAMLRDYLSDRRVEEVPQIFCPYKEALSLYRLGIDLPEDVTLLWADDNFGHMRQLSTPQEQQRAGGGGVYYHFSYWGKPQDYLWLGTTSPALVAFEMQKAYDLNCKDMWVFNVGDIKPIEYELQFAMDYAWDVYAVNIFDADAYALKWGAEMFGEAYAQAVYEIKKEYFRLAAQGRPEHIHRVTYSEQEIRQRLTDYGVLVQKVNALAEKLPEEKQDAYFELIAYPVKAAAAMNEKILGARLSFLYKDLDKIEAMHEMSARSKSGYTAIQRLTRQYNKETAGGKWDGIMDYAPRKQSCFYPMAVASEWDPSKALETTDKPEVRTATILRADEYKGLHANGKHFKVFKGLGHSGASLVVWPMDTTSYDEESIRKAPYAEYDVLVQAGDNTLELRFLPTFPIYSGYGLRYGISQDGGSTIRLQSIETEAQQGAWNTNVLRNYAASAVTIHADKEKKQRIRIYFADPGLALTSLKFNTK